MGPRDRARDGKLSVELRQGPEAGRTCGLAVGGRSCLSGLLLGAALWVESVVPARLRSGGFGPDRGIPSKGPIELEGGQLVPPLSPLPRGAGSQDPVLV